MRSVCANKKILILFFLCFLFIGCSSIMEMRAVGTVIDGINFSLYEKSSSKVKAVSLNEFYVQKKTSEDWSVVWAIEGRGKVGHLQYGVVPKGYKETQAPSTLTPQSEYRALAYFTANGPGFAACGFSIDGNGAVLANPCK